MASKRRVKRVTGRRAVKACLGKEQIAHEEEAKGKSLRVQSETGAKMTWYRCPHCRFFHVAHGLTRKPKRNRG